jgi:hypothetical protein
MENFKEVNKEIADKLLNITYESGDLSDIGNEIGIIIAKYFDDNNTKDDFFHGIKHGISLTDGTHG